MKKLAVIVCLVMCGLSYSSDNSFEMEQPIALGQDNGIYVGSVFDPQQLAARANTISEGTSNRDDFSI